METHSHQSSWTACYMCGGSEMVWTMKENIRYACVKYNSMTNHNQKFEHL